MECERIYYIELHEISILLVYRIGYFEPCVSIVYIILLANTTYGLLDEADVICTCCL